MMKDDNEDDLKPKRTCTGGIHTALDIFRFAVLFYSKRKRVKLGVIGVIFFRFYIFFEGPKWGNPPKRIKLFLVHCQ